MQALPKFSSGFPLFQMMIPVLGWLLMTGIMPVAVMGQGISTDTVTISLQQAEMQFVKNNLQLLAQKYNVDATQALILQAKLYPNPNIGLNQGAYNTQTRKWFEQDYANGEQAYQVSQLIVLSRKIHKQVNMAETNYKLAQDNLLDLLRSLKYALRSSWYTIYFLQQTARVYDEEIHGLQMIVNAYDKVKNMGYVSAADVAMIQAQLYSLQNEYQSLLDNINDQESQLRLLLQDSTNVYIQPVIAAEIVRTDPSRIPLKTLMDSAVLNRTDMMISRDNLTLSQQNFTLQKAMAVPDLTAGVSMDRHGGYVPNYSSISLNMDIPLFNRNQGNIKNAQIMVEDNKTQLLLNQKTVEEQVARAWQKAMDAERLYKGIDSSFAGNFKTLAQEMMKNYMKRNVNLITFLTFYDSYKQNIVQLNGIFLNKAIDLENINYVTGTDFYDR